MESFPLLIVEFIVLVIVLFVAEFAKEFCSVWSLISKFISLVKGDTATPRARLILAAIEDESEHSELLAIKPVLESLASHPECGPVFQLASEAIDHVTANPAA